MQKPKYNPRQHTVKMKMMFQCPKGVFSTGICKISMKRNRVYEQMEEDRFTKILKNCRITVHDLRALSLRSRLPLRLRLPVRYQSLRVEVGGDYVTEWTSAQAVQIYPDMPTGDREDRHEYLRYLDETAYVNSFLTTNRPFQTPLIHM